MRSCVFQAALEALYGPLGEDLNPSALISIQHLQGLMPQDHYPGGSGTRRAATAQQQQQQQQQGYGTGGGGGGVQEQGGNDSLAGEGGPGGAEGLLGVDRQLAAAAAAEQGARRHVPGDTYIGLEQMQRYNSAGLARRVPGGCMSQTTRAAGTMALRVMATDGVIPPASGPLRMGQGADTTYEPDDLVQGHRHRTPAWSLPPNRTALSKQWISTAAMEYL